MGLGLSAAETVWKSERAEANALVFDLLVGFVDNKNKRLKPALSF